MPAPHHPPLCPAPVPTTLPATSHKPDEIQKKTKTKTLNNPPAGAARTSGVGIRGSTGPGGGGQARRWLTGQEGTRVSGPPMGTHRAPPGSWGLAASGAQGHTRLPLTRSGRAPLGPDVSSCDLLTKHVTRHNSAPAPGPPKLPRFHSGSSGGALSSGVHTRGPMYSAAGACSDDDPRGRGSRAGAEPALPSLSSNPQTEAVDMLGGPQLRHPARTAGRTLALSVGWGQSQHRQWLGSECMLFVPGSGPGACQVLWVSAVVVPNVVPSISTAQPKTRVALCISATRGAGGPEGDG